MLVKLLKYELRSTSRIILYIYAGILAAATLMGILGRFLSGRWETTDGMTIVFGAEDANSIVATLFLALFLIYFFLMAALCVLTIVMIIMRFYNSITRFRYILWYRSWSYSRICPIIQHFPMSFCENFIFFVK